jgi:hypothetical protein
MYRSDSVAKWPGLLAHEHPEFLNVEDAVRIRVARVEIDVNVTF